MGYSVHVFRFLIVDPSKLFDLSNISEGFRKWVKKTQVISERAYVAL